MSVSHAFELRFLSEIEYEKWEMDGKLKAAKTDEVDEMVAKVRGRMGEKAESCV